jgi:hypothetical protein
LFDECINKRNMSITSNLLPTCAIDHPQWHKEPFLSPKHQEECYACTQLMDFTELLIWNFHCFEFQHSYFRLNVKFSIRTITSS